MVARLWDGVEGTHQSGLADTGHDSCVSRHGVYGVRIMTPDRVAGWATGIGIGFAVFIITWIVLNRLTSLWLPVPEGPIVALSAAVLAGMAVALERGKALSRKGRDLPN